MGRGSRSGQEQLLAVRNSPLPTLTGKWAHLRVLARDASAKENVRIATFMPRFTRDCPEMNQNEQDRGVLGSLQENQRPHPSGHHASGQYAAGCLSRSGDARWKFDRSVVFLFEYGLDWLIHFVRIPVLTGHKTSPTLQAFTCNHLRDLE